MVEHCRYLAEVGGSIPTRAYHSAHNLMTGRAARALRQGLLCLLVGMIWPIAALTQTTDLPDDSGQFKGTLERGPDGRLRLKPKSEPRPPDATSGPLHPPGSVTSIRQSVDWAHRRLRRVAGYDHDQNARRLQQEIDTMVARERRAKGFGAATRPNELTAAEQRLVTMLKGRDHAVRQHESMHYEMGRPYTQLPRYWYVVGPDGRRYAVSGSVSFAFDRFSQEPHKLLHQLSVLQRAALAPREPSAQDLAIARTLGEIIQGLRNRAAAGQ